MSEFKFFCPSCGQKILTETAAISRETACPGCGIKLVVPEPANPPDQTPVAKAAGPKDVAAKLTTKEQPTGARDEPLKSAGAAKPNAAAQTAASATSEPQVRAPEKRTQVAQLTPSIKREIIRSVRRRISEESHWMPRVTEQGEFAYAAKLVDGKWVHVDAMDPEATRYSLLGAVLIEFNERNVPLTASGRLEFLDREFPQAIRSASGQNESDELRPITHAQSLKALDLLDERYTREEEANRSESSNFEDLRLAELNRRIERKDSVTVEQLCAALSNELKEVKGRLAELERSAGKGS